MADYKVESMWECQWCSEFAERRDHRHVPPNVAEDMLSIRDPLDPREGLYGGRLDCYRMHFKSFHHPIMSSEPLVWEGLRKRCARYLDEY